MSCGVSQKGECICDLGVFHWTGLQERLGSPQHNICQDSLTRIILTGAQRASSAVLAVDSWTTFVTGLEGAPPVLNATSETPEKLEAGAHVHCFLRPVLPQGSKQPPL